LKLDRYGNGLAKGLTVTFKHLFRHPITTQYPEERLTPSKRTRGNELVWDNVKCTGCTSCARSCPQGAIRIVTSVNPGQKRYGVVRIEVDTGYCISCGLCVEACPYRALYMGYSYERAKYRRGDLVQADEMLLASPGRPASSYMYPKKDKDLPEQTLLVYKKH
jgi:NAD(P)H-quinone oxidoreductase subunit I